MQSLTYAQRAKRVLNSKGIASYLTKTPPEITTRGCGYALKVNADKLYAAYDTLSQSKLRPLGVFKADYDGGTYERVEL